MAGESPTVKTIVSNRKARFEYEILDRVEAGIVLRGTEVKSVRAGQVSLQESYAEARDGELWLQGCTIQPYEHGNINNHEPTRARKLLLHRKELDKLVRRVEEKGLTLVPLSLYFKGSNLKIELGLARGKKFHDKRETTKAREADRRMRRGDD